MTNEPIMIDDVDVYECTYSKIGIDKKCYCEQDLYDDGTPVFTCDECTDCYYKQLKRKEQECEEWKNKLAKSFADERKKEIVIDLLKAENERYKQALQEIKEIAYELTNEEYTDFIEYKQKQILQKCEVVNEKE